MRGPRTNDLTISRTVGANVATLRTLHGWSQRALAQHTETTDKPVGFSTIARIEKAANGAKPVAVYIDDAVSLAAALGVILQRLITPPNCRACMD